jgi:hypothetical protein
MKNKIMLQLVSTDIYNFLYLCRDNYDLIVKILTTANNKENQQTKENLFSSVKQNNILQFHYDLVCKIKKIEH